MTSRHACLLLIRAVLAVAVAPTVVGCASGSGAAIRQYMDESTSASVTVAGRPLVFARERPEFAVNARDYLTLVPLEVDRGGSRALYFYGYAWSTIDKRSAGEVQREPMHFELVADGRPVPISSPADDPRHLGIARPPLQPPSANAVLLLTATTNDVLELVRGAGEIHVVTDEEGNAGHYDLWDDGRLALSAFLQEVR